MKFFRSPEEFRRWLEKHHARERELWVGFWKRETGKPSLTWPQSVDEALCFGWIDGVRRRVDARSYTIRFTPRKAGSVWSAVNTRKVAGLRAAGKMRPAGLAAFAKREAKKSGVYSFENRDKARFDRAAERQFRANRQAWAWFSAQAPWFRRVATWWVVSARKPETRARRLAEVIENAAQGRRPAPFLLRAAVTRDHG